MSEISSDGSHGKTKRKLCLGIESTAHTYGVGIVDFEGNVLSTVNDIYVPDSGGLHPRKVVEHHNSVFMTVIQKALENAGVKLTDIDLISFSQGPGLGPCLRIGAGTARALAGKLKIPLIGANHCIGHVEIGRRVSGAMDPLTLYVSGGNTIISAFETGRYQVFGETLDLAVGNMIDMVARDLNLPHPGGPKIEKMAAKSEKYLPLPYIVKGMDLSFSGIYTQCRKLIKSKDFGVKYNENDIANSLQETAFAMLTEVTERALAHTEKKEVLLTGGVAANKRLQEMIKYIAEEHGATYYVVPLRLAGDNGAMLGWTGILHYLNKGGMQVKDTRVIPKWRMDEVDVPWRLPGAKVTGMEAFTNKDVPQTTTLTSTLTKNETGENNSLKEKETISNLFNGNYEIIRKGAEAELIKAKLLGKDVLVKYRLEKKYRIPALDLEIRNQRAVSEARSLIRVKKFNVPVPMVYELDNKNAAITMSFIEGKRLKDLISTLSSAELQNKFKEVGKYIGRLHKNNQIHGDLTTSNIMIMPNDNMFFIDFGLAFNSTTIEDKAVDLHLFKRVVTSTHGSYYDDIFPPFVEGFIDEYGEGGQQIVDEIEDVELRGRYVEKSKRKRGVVKP